MLGKYNEGEKKWNDPNPLRGGNQCNTDTDNSLFRLRAVGRVFVHSDHLQSIRKLQETSGDKAAAAGGEGDEPKENLQKKAKLQTDDLKGAPVKRITDFFAAR